MHVEFLGFVSTFAAALVFLNLAIGTAIVTGYRKRPLYTWWLVAAFGLLSVYFSMFAVSAGTAPIWNRGLLAMPIRVTLLIDLVLFVVWGICLVVDLARHRQAKPSITYRLALLTSLALLLRGASS